MTAKEMFEELGYKKYEDGCTLSYENNDYIVRFWKKSKRIELFGDKYFEGDLENHLYYVYDFRMFIAINKQVEELGWNE